MENVINQHLNQCKTTNEKIAYINQTKTILAKKLAELTTQQNIEQIIHKVDENHLAYCHEQYNIDGLKSIKVKYYFWAVSYDINCEAIDHLSHHIDINIQRQKDWIDYLLADSNHKLKLDELDWKLDESSDWVYGDWDDPRRHLALVSIYLYYRPVLQASKYFCYIITPTGDIYDVDNKVCKKYANDEILCVVDDINKYVPSYNIFYSYHHEIKKEHINNMLNVLVSKQKISEGDSDEINLLIEPITNIFVLTSVIRLISMAMYVDIDITINVINKAIDRERLIQKFCHEMNTK